mmetsp:Transcript_51673/g.121312  ORF Transcript_51673/g.121312 Transcript_51673/m.121312 type:complete len:345 (-) Transcript_51673:501-1535(-)
MAWLALRLRSSAHPPTRAPNSAASAAPSSSRRPRTSSAESFGQCCSCCASMRAGSAAPAPRRDAHERSRRAREGQERARDATRVSKVAEEPASSQSASARERSSGHCATAAARACEPCSLMKLPLRSTCESLRWCAMLEIKSWRSAGLQSVREKEKCCRDCRLARCWASTSSCPLKATFERFKCVRAGSPVTLFQNDWLEDGNFQAGGRAESDILSDCRAGHCASALPSVRRGPGQKCTADSLTSVREAHFRILSDLVACLHMRPARDKSTRRSCSVLLSPGRLPRLCNSRSSSSGTPQKDTPTILCPSEAAFCNAFTAIFACTDGAGCPSSPSAGPSQQNTCW